MSRPLLGLIAMVTGASGGIGAGIARQLAEAGANVVLAARRQERIEVLAAELSRRYKVKCLAVPTDVTKRQSVKDCVQTAMSFYNRDGIDILVNNAGVMHYTKMKNLLEDQWEQAVDINCKGVLNGVGAVLPSMLKRGSGHIINISSDA
eukprot:GSChrysophyteH1.ASY1.ANO1.374.1 assembled CDS